MPLSLFYHRKTFRFTLPKEKRLYKNYAIKSSNKYRDRISNCNIKYKFHWTHWCPHCINDVEKIFFVRERSIFFQMKHGLKILMNLQQWMFSPGDIRSPLFTYVYEVSAQSYVSFFSIESPKKYVADMVIRHHVFLKNKAFFFCIKAWSILFPQKGWRHMIVTAYKFRIEFVHLPT